MTTHCDRHDEESTNGCPFCDLEDALRETMRAIRDERGFDVGVRAAVSVRDALAFIVNRGNRSFVISVAASSESKVLSGALVVQCPKCGAPPGYACLKKAIGEFHEERLTSASQIPHNEVLLAR